ANLSSNLWEKTIYTLESLEDFDYQNPVIPTITIHQDISFPPVSSVVYETKLDSKINFPFDSHDDQSISIDDSLIMVYPRANLHHLKENDHFRIIKLDINSGEINWELEIDDLFLLWSMQIVDQYLYLFSFDLREFDYYNQNGEEKYAINPKNMYGFYCIDLRNGKLKWYSPEKNMKPYSIYINPGDGLYYNELIKGEFKGKGLKRIDFETGEVSELKSDLEPHTYLNENVYYTVSNEMWDSTTNQRWSSKCNKVASIEKIDLSTQERLWRSNKKYCYAYLLDKKATDTAKSKHPVYVYYDPTYIEGPEYYTKIMPIRNDKVFFAFGNGGEFKEGCEGYLEITLEGIGCLDSETGKVLWENTELDEYYYYVGNIIADFGNDYIVFGDTKYSMEDGHLIEKDFKSHGNNWDRGSVVPDGYTMNTFSTFDKFDKKTKYIELYDCNRPCEPAFRFISNSEKIKRLISHPRKDQIIMLDGNKFIVFERE
ncbi:MAG: hypothetical protein R2883_04470, partial [Caldisericia bacterium]